MHLITIGILQKPKPDMPYLRFQTPNILLQFPENPVEVAFSQEMPTDAADNMANTVCLGNACPEKKPLYI